MDGPVSKGRQGTPNTLTMVLAAISVAIVVFYAATRKWPDVPATLLSGRYHNQCCQDLVIDGAYMQYGPSKVRYSVRNMKYGTELTPERPIGRFFSRTAHGGEEANMFLATMKGRNVSIAAMDDGGREYDFEKVVAQRPAS